MAPEREILERPTFKRTDLSGFIERRAEVHQDKPVNEREKAVFRDTMTMVALSSGIVLQDESNGGNEASDLLVDLLQDTVVRVYEGGVVREIESSDMEAYRRLGVEEVEEVLRLGSMFGVSLRRVLLRRGKISEDQDNPKILDVEADDMEEALREIKLLRQDGTPSVNGGVKSANAAGVSRAFEFLGGKRE